MQYLVTFLPSREILLFSWLLVTFAQEHQAKLATRKGLQIHTISQFSARKLQYCGRVTIPLYNSILCHAIS